MLLVSIETRNVSNYALKNVNTYFPHAKLNVILGPNGAGKTTLLKTIGGLVDYSGSILFDGEPIDHLKPYKRGVALVPQNNSLFRNMNVFENIAFGLKARGLKNDFVRKKVIEVARMLRIENILDRYPATLSGGEAKKVALARALAIEPKVIMLDEPFESLDVEARVIVEQEIMMAIKRLRRTTLIVSHEVDKAVSMAENLTILWMGRCIFSGKPSELEESILPREALFWLGTIIKADEVLCRDGVCFARISNLEIPVKNQAASNSGCKILLPSCRVRVCKKGGVKGVVVDVEEYRGSYHAVIDVGGFRVNVTTPINLRRMEEVRLRIDGCITLNP